MSKKPVSDAIREARARMGWSQADLAKILGVSQAAVGQWERGTTVPRVKHMLIMRDSFDQTFRTEMGYGGGDGAAYNHSTSPTTLGSPGVQNAPYPSSRHGLERLLTAEHKATAVDFDKVLAQALQRLDPTLQMHVTVGGETDLSQWIVDYMTQKTVVEVKHPDSFVGMEEIISRSLLQLAVLRSILGEERNYVVVVRRPIQAPLSDCALPPIERKIAKLTTEASLLRLHLLVVNSVEEAVKHITELEIHSARA